MTQTESRYQRQIAMTAIGVAGQDKLAKASVLCIGAGGLAATVLPALTAAGIGRIGLVDDDRVALSNLNRQFLYRHDDIGHLKVELAAKRLRQSNPDVELIALPERFTSMNAAQLIGDFDYVIDCADNHQTSIFINDWSYYLKKPFIFASISQFSGMIGYFDIRQGPCLRCWNQFLPTSGEDCAVDGILGSVAALFGALQANEVIKAIVGKKGRNQNRLLLFDTVANKTQYLAIEEDSECLACQKHSQPAASEEPEEKGIEITIDTLDLTDWLIIDIRQESSRLIAQELLEHRCLSADQVLDQHQHWPEKQHVLIVCQRGIRSKQLVQQLRQKGCTQAYSCIGGVEGQPFASFINRLS